MKIFTTQELNEMLMKREMSIVSKSEPTDSTGDSQNYLVFVEGARDDLPRSEGVPEGFNNLLTYYTTEENYGLSYIYTTKLKISPNDQKP